MKLVARSIYSVGLSIDLLTAFYALSHGYELAGWMLILLTAVSTLALTPLVNQAEKSSE